MGPSRKADLMHYIAAWDAILELESPAFHENDLNGAGQGQRRSLDNEIVLQSHNVISR